MQDSCWKTWIMLCWSCKIRELQYRVQSHNLHRARHEQIKRVLKAVEKGLKVIPHHHLESSVIVILTVENCSNWKIVLGKIESYSYALKIKLMNSSWITLKWLWWSHLNNTINSILMVEIELKISIILIVFKTSWKRRKT